MEFFSKELRRTEEFEKKIETLCHFNNAKCEFKQGRILDIKGTNISFIEPHRIDVKVKDKKVLLLYFDEDNLFLYNRQYKITLKQLRLLLKLLKENEL